MDFKAKMEEFQQNVTTPGSKQTVEISQIESNITALNERISKIETDIKKYEKEHATKLNEIATKKELIAHLKAALEEHKIKLQTNQKLVETYKTIEQNQNSIDLSLNILKTKKVEIETAMNDFKQMHPHINPATQKLLQEELEKKNNEWNTVNSNIQDLLDLESKMYGFVKLFLVLLELIGWRTDPKAIEHNKLESLKQEIDNITQSIASYMQLQKSLEELQSEKNTVISETTKILHQQDNSTRLENTKTAISESTTTIKALNQKIEEENKNCVILTEEIKYNSSYLKTIAPLQNLRQEQSEKMALLQVKKQELALIQDPERTKLRTEFADSLITITSTHAEHIEKKKTLAQNNQFFTYLAGEHWSIVPNNIAFKRLKISINKYAKELDIAGSEAKTLSRIKQKLELWYRQEHYSKGSFEGRINAHAIFQKDIQELIAKLPMDNPLNVALNFIQVITTPIQPASSEQTNDSGHKEISRKNPSPSSGFRL